MILRGLGPVLLRNPIFLSFSRGVGSGPLSPPLDPQMPVNGFSVYKGLTISLLVLQGHFMRTLNKMALRS